MNGRRYSTSRQQSTRRRFVATAAGTTLATVTLAGCTADADESVYTYALSMDDREQDAPEDAVLSFDERGLARGQETIVRTAVMDGSYTEEDVSWSPIPGRKPISAQFKMVLQMVARHLGEGTRLEPGVSLSTPSEFDGDRYRADVTIE